MGLPILPAATYPEDTVDFGESFSRSLKGHRKLNVNFYIDDEKNEGDLLIIQKRRKKRGCRIQWCGQPLNATAP